MRLTLAIVLGAGAIGFGIWATLVSNPNLFSRLVNLAIVWTGVAAVLGLAGTVATRPESDKKTAERAQPAPGAPPANQNATPAAGPLNSGDVPREPPGFVRRADLLAALDEPGAAGGVLVVLAVTGMRGVGKTQLAAAYARARRADQWRLVAWIDAETPGGLLAGLAQTADSIGLQASDADAAGRAVRHWLEADGHRCLLVFDNATDPDLIEPFIPSGGQATVLITSNQQDMANLGTAVSVDVFTVRQAADYLADRTGLGDPAEAAALAEELGYLPLALAQAVAVIAGQHLDYGTYRDRLRSTPVADLLGPVAASHYRRGAAAAILVALDAVAAADPSGACTGVMGVLAVLSASGVPRSLIRAAGEQGLLGGERLATATVDVALGRLAGSSLVTFSLDGAIVTAHRLVMRVIRDQHAIAGTFADLCDRAAALLYSQAITAYEQRHADRTAARDLAGQILALHSAISARAGPGDLNSRMLDLRSEAVVLLGELGDNPALAMEAAEALLADCEQVLGPDHPDTLRSRSNLATAYLDAGRTSEAITLHEQTLTARDRILGRDHQDTLTSRTSLASAYRAAGRTSEAIALHEQTLTARDRLRGSDHQDTLKSQESLANAYLDAGRTSEAIALHEQTLTAYNRILGPDHPDILRSCYNLAIAYLHAGRTSEAITLHEQTLTARDRILGPDHPDTLRSRRHLAYAYEAAGRSADAERLRRRQDAASG